MESIERGGESGRAGDAEPHARRCDVLVVGGGINGAGIARDLAGRGFSVILCERDDLASHTSSSSTKLIHGGLRYLEHYEFGLVRKALAEREVLLRNAPHIIWPLRFVMPHDPAMRPFWLIRAGLFLYDHLARREVLPASRTVRLGGGTPPGVSLQPRFERGFEYSDAWVDDARLVVLNAVDAAARGATVLTRCACVEARREPDGWRASLRHADGTALEVRARALVNAAGPWAARFLGQCAGVPAARPLRLVKGSHIVVRRLFEHPHAYIFQSPDGRIVFAIPYEGEFTLIGTTDVEQQGDPGDARIDQGEVGYLCAQVSRYFARRVDPADVVWSYSGVRPLLDDEHGNPAAVTRDYRLELSAGASPLLSVWGGKITTYRRLAEEAADMLGKALAADGRAPSVDGRAARAASPAPGRAWTAHAPLPGGDLGEWIAASGNPVRDFAAFEHALAGAYPGLEPVVRHRLARCYGTRIGLVFAGAAPGEPIVPGVYEGELDYLRRHEWARTLDDVLWRRTKLGLHLTAAQVSRLSDWWRDRDAASARVPLRAPG